MIGFALSLALALLGSNTIPLTPAEIAPEATERSRLVLAVEWDGPCGEDFCWLVVSVPSDGGPGMTATWNYGELDVYEDGSAQLWGGR